MDARGTNRTFEDFDATVEWSHADDASAVKIILPGFRRDEIRVLVDSHGHLRTFGERPVVGNKWRRFQKDFQLPSDSNIDGIRAKFENEVLTITLPKKIPSPQAAPMPMPMPAPPPPVAPKPEPSRPAMEPPQRPPPALREPAKPSPPVLPPAPSRKPSGERRPSVPRKVAAPEREPPRPAAPPVPARPAAPPVPARPAAPVPEVETPTKYYGGAATAKPGQLAPVPKPQVVAEEEERWSRWMEREARGKMEEDRKMREEKEKAAKEEEDRVMWEMDMAQRRMPASASRDLLVNVAVAVVVLVGIAVYVWRN